MSDRRGAEWSGDKRIDRGGVNAFCLYGMLMGGGGLVAVGTADKMKR